MRRGLGKGLRELIGGLEEESGVREIETASIIANPRQPRKTFDSESLQELCESLKQHGVLQPLIVRPLEHGSYELIAGERRWRAAKMAGIESVPAIIRNADNRESLEWALVENVQRKDISPLDAAEAYKLLIEEFDLTQEEVAERVGKSRVSVANALRLLRLPRLVQEGLNEGRITEGHARALLQLGTAVEQELVYKKILEEDLSVRDVEKIAQGPKTIRRQVPTQTLIANPIETLLSEKFGTRVRVSAIGMGGEIRIEYYDEEDLQRILEILEVQE